MQAQSRHDLTPTDTIFTLPNLEIPEEYYRPIGHGGFGYVYKAHYESPISGEVCSVAVKKMVLNNIDQMHVRENRLKYMHRELNILKTLEMHAFSQQNLNPFETDEQRNERVRRQSIFRKFIMRLYQAYRH